MSADTAFWILPSPVRCFLLLFLCFMANKIKMMMIDDSDECSI